MTHQNHQTNGASLEDCHTNFFALTELYGIKWRKLVWGETNGGGGGDSEDGAAPLADPVISSYARCLAGDILCVWRRVSPPSADIYDMSAPAPPPLALTAAKELWIFWYGEEPDLVGLVAPELISSQGEHGSWESGLSYECRSLLFKALHNLIERCLLSRDFVRLGKWFVQPYDGDEEDVGKSPWHLSFSFAFFLHGESTVCASVDVRQHPPVRTLTARRRHHMQESTDDDKVILAPFGLEARVTGREWGPSDAAAVRLCDAWRQLWPLEQDASVVEVWCGGVRMRYPVPYVLVAEREHPAPRKKRAHTPSPAPIEHRPLASLPTLTQSTEHSFVDGSGDKYEDFVDPTRKTLCTCAKWVRRRRARAPPFHRRAQQPVAAASTAITANAHAATHRDNLSCSDRIRAGSGVGCVAEVRAGSAGSAGCPGGTGSPSSAPPTPHASPPTSPHTRALHPSTQASGLVPPSLHTPAPTPDPTTPAPPSATANTKLYSQGDSPPNGAALTSSGAAMVTEGCEESLRRPRLPSPPPRVDPTQDEHELHMLYDYTTVTAWLEHPVKRFKVSCEPLFAEEMALGAGSRADLYAGHDHISMAATPHYADIKREKQENEDCKEYKNLFTSDGLCPTLKDLDQIFDNSDDANSGDETVRLLQTPPDSNKSSSEERTCVTGSGAGVRCVRAEELSKMFPTPPSMEAHAQPSPSPAPNDEEHREHREHDNTIEDWSYVFKPPAVCKYVGSSKYAPLQVLPSQLLPPVSLPGNAVYSPRRHPPKHVPEPECPPQNNNKNNSATETPVTIGSTNNTSRGAWMSSRSPGVARAPRSVCSVAPTTPAPAPTPAPPPSGAVPACPLLVNVLLSDTVLNIFRDHNFDSCTLCVCTAGPRVVGNIRGADAAAYLPGWGSGGGRRADGMDDEPSRCSCGYSAVLNRRLAHKSGLFQEDEMDITGGIEDGENGESENGNENNRGIGRLAGVASALLGALAQPLPGAQADALLRAAAKAAAACSEPISNYTLHLVEYKDGGVASRLALLAAARGVSTSTSRVIAAAMHRWAFLTARGRVPSRDVVRLMRRLRPLLQDAIQKRCAGARMWDGVSGPLTWRQFHRLAGRGNEDPCEPQPVPALLVGHDSDWLAVSPYALPHWDRLCLEPYAYARDLAYLVVAPAAPDTPNGDDTLAEPLRAFFRELSCAYHSCRLGRHRPLAKYSPDGIVRVPAEEGAVTEAQPEWEGSPPPGRLDAYLRGYARAMRANLLPQLAALTLDRSALEPEPRSAPPMPTPAPVPTPTPGAVGEAPPPSPEPEIPAPPPRAAPPTGDDESGPPALVIYLVEPPHHHSHRAATLHSLLTMATKIFTALEHHNPLIKVISLEGIWEWWGGGGGAGAARALALSVYAGSRRLLRHGAPHKSLTGLANTPPKPTTLHPTNDNDKGAGYRLYTPAWVLAPRRSGAGGGVGAGAGGDSWGGGCGAGDAAVLFVSYCLSQDHRWLLAAACDARGELLDSTLIDVHLPARARGRARRLGLTKLMDWALGVMSQAPVPWRLVVGRLGRMGHHELKGWSWLLSRRGVMARTTAISAGTECNACGGAALVSACLVSTAPEPALRLMPDRFTPDERFAHHSHLHTPRDVSATHILVFPTSATTQSNQMPFEQPMANGEDNDMNMFLDVEMEDEDLGEDNMTDLVGDMFNNLWPQGSPRASPRRDHDDAASPPPHHTRAPALHPNAEDAVEQVGTVLQQPLALGYTVSTAPLGELPAWMWGGGSRDSACPAFLKTALLLHAAHLHADELPLSARHTHPLDSATTTDVLRYVLEGYNALSWLALDASRRDRLSCLPLHLQLLLQLYHASTALS